MSEHALCRILLDVDGVLNAVCLRPDRGQWPDWETAECRGFRITYSPTVGERLLTLTEMPGVELWWLTTWEHEANIHIGPLFDWPWFPVLDRHDIEDRKMSGLVLSTGPWWKFVEAKKLWERDQVSFVWIDDDLDGVADDGAADWVRSLDGQALGIRPDPARGLTDRLLTEIESFVTRIYIGAGS